MLLPSPVAMDRKAAFICQRPNLKMNNLFLFRYQEFEEKYIKRITSTIIGGQENTQDQAFVLDLSWF
jgi:hypothetical protein